MANIDASTPQMKAVKKWIDSMTSLDISKVVPLISRNFKYQSFPETIDLPEVHEQAKGAYIQWFGGLMTCINKYEASLQRRSLENRLQACRLIAMPLGCYS